jgi:hypothetical protein
VEARINSLNVTNRDEQQSLLPLQGPNAGDILPLFDSFFLGGFECSTHRLLKGRRLDLIASTKHDKFASLDYARLRKVGIRAARDGIRWHLIEKSAGSYDFSSALPMLRAARETGLQVIWDIFHYGWPEHINIFQLLS